MKYKLGIKSYLGKVLFTYESDKEPTIREAVEAAIKNSADLRSADLSSADLSSADLSSADLRSAVGTNKYWTTPLYLLLDQPGKIRAYKLINSEGEGPMNGGIKYEIGKTYEIIDANINEKQDCGAGINVAMLKEAMEKIIGEYEAKGADRNDTANSMCVCADEALTRLAELEKGSGR